MEEVEEDDVTRYCDHFPIELGLIVSFRRRLSEFHP